MMRLLLLTMLLTALASPAVSAMKKGFGDGNLSCGAWTQERQSSSQSSSSHVRQWVLGYVSGANYWNEYQDFLGPVDAPAIYAWIDNYCRSNPLEKLIVAADRLVQELWTHKNEEQWLHEEGLPKGQSK
jgi:hypothetical protein